MRTMKHYLFLILIAGVLCAPALVRADEISYSEAWAFLYAFPLSWQGGHLAQDGSYQITTGDVPATGGGAWTLTLLDEQRRFLSEYPFDPSVLAQSGRFTIIVPTEGRGALARFTDDTDRAVLELDMRGSRVCNDDGVCRGDAGERTENCPTDCGAQAAVPGNVQTAAIAPQLSLSARAGSILLRLALGMAGIMLLVGVGRMLDSRRSP